MSGFSFNELNLSGVEIQSGGLMLKPGKHLLKVKSAKVEDAKSRDGSKVLALLLEDIGGMGSIKTWLNVFHKTSAEATRIGRSELKSLLFYGGHPNPDNPGDVRTIEGLVVGGLVVEQKYTRTRNGVSEEKTGVELKKFLDPHEVDPSRYPNAKVLPQTAQGAAPAAAGGMNDEIPF